MQYAADINNKALMWDWSQTSNLTENHDVVAKAEGSFSGKTS